MCAAGCQGGAVGAVGNQTTRDRSGECKGEGGVVGARFLVGLNLYVGGVGVHAAGYVGVARGAIVLHVYVVAYARYVASLLTAAIVQNHIEDIGVGHCPYVVLLATHGGCFAHSSARPCASQLVLLTVPEVDVGCAGCLDVDCDDSIGVHLAEGHAACLFGTLGVCGTPVDGEFVVVCHILANGYGLVARQGLLDSACTNFVPSAHSGSVEAYGHLLGLGLEAATCGAELNGCAANGILGGVEKVGSWVGE